MKPAEIEYVWSTPEQCQHCSVRELVLFADLQRRDFDLIHFPIESIALKADQTLYRERDPSRHVYTIRSGLIKLVRFLPDGKTRIVRLLQQGDLAGIEALHQSFYLQNAVALLDTEVCRIPVKDLEQLNRQTPHLYRQLIARWHKVQEDADIWLAEFNIGNARERLAKLLLYLTHSQKNDEFFLPTREDIGAILAITTETASRIIAEFKRQNYLQTYGQYASIDLNLLTKSFRL